MKNLKIFLAGFYRTISGVVYIYIYLYFELVLFYLDLQAVDAGNCDGVS